MRFVPWSGPALLAVFLLTVAILPVGPGWAMFWADPRTRLWHFMLAAQAVLWTAALSWAWRPLFHRDSPWSERKNVRLWPKVYALLFASAGYIPVIDHPVAPYIERSKLPYHDGKMIVFEFIGVSVVVLHVWGLLTIHGEASNELAMLKGTMTEQEFTQVVARYRRLQSQVRGCVSWVGVIIAAGMLATGALRKLLDAPEFSPEIVIAYGLYSTLLLALVFIPAQYTVKALGEELARRLSRLDPLESKVEVWKSWSDEQKAIEDYLGLQQSPLQMMQSAISVLAPLVGSVSALVLQK